MGTTVIQSKVGEVGYNKSGVLMKIVEYNSSSDIMVEFQDEHKHKVHTTMQHFKEGAVKNIYDRTVCGVGYLGEVLPNGYNQWYSYKAWHDMMHRCYNTTAYYTNRLTTYTDCYVCDEWHSYNNFKQWFDENYYSIENERISLDKDILIKGNKVYSPNTCIFCPQKINAIFTKRQANRGDLPIGVTERHNKYHSVLTSTLLGRKTTVTLGTFDTVEEAFTAYKNYKENYIKQVADIYKDKIPQRLYDALYSYQVEITD